MNTKKTIIILFVLIAVIQLAVPLKMILNEESVLKNGTSYKFEVAPIDPNDPFRGKYIALRYQETSFKVPNSKNWHRKEKVYVVLKKNKDGFMKIKDLVKEEPSETSEYVRAEIDYVSRYQENEIHISFPFNRYYMEEKKAYDAEIVYNESLRDSIDHNTYALVFVKDGKAVLKDVLIDNISIKELVVEKEVNYK
jgi:uncharacterized membrane-anchored protein